jgi:hypothetical protein
VGDDQCLRQHQNKIIASPPKEELINSVVSVAMESKQADRLLTELLVPHVKVSYEKLYFDDDIAVEWRRLFSFLGVGPSDESLTSYDLRARMEHAPTSNHSVSLRDKLQNYEEVAETLRGTEYEIYLYR